MQLDSAVFSCVAGNYRFRLVGRAEVDNDEFKFAKGLVQDAFDRLCEKAINVAHHHHDEATGCSLLFVRLQERSTKYHALNLSHTGLDVECMTGPHPRHPGHLRALVRVSCKIRNRVSHRVHRSRRDNQAIHLMGDGFCISTYVCHNTWQATSHCLEDRKRQSFAV